MPSPGSSQAIPQEIPGYHQIVPIEPPPGCSKDPDPMFKFCQPGRTIFSSPIAIDFLQRASPFFSRTRLLAGSDIISPFFTPIVGHYFNSAKKNICQSPSSLRFSGVGIPSLSQPRERVILIEHLFTLDTCPAGAPSFSGSFRRRAGSVSSLRPKPRLIL